MPQLNPSPWLSIFLMSWLIYLIILLPKVGNLKVLNKTTTQSSNTIETQPWNWPWT
uniref:ATP synthase complex subunit 8 n=1 Tax=Batrachoseps attenuatus TaxID=159185 RepID=Q644K0_BATAT|nr:ATP synthase F0 subunit 8 [Batrachoseps attenuatus]AAU20634.1 ATP synthase F0 subunit 8 [Batrachoseps attenuatus]ABX46731.1 ATPase subunit 8 [Batrachoseps attenuatus]